MKPKNRFAAMVEEFRGKLGVTPPSIEETPRKRFGSNGLRVNGRIFAMLSSENRLVVKLPRERVEALVASGDGVQFDPRHDGRLMKEWLVLEPTSKIEWLKLAREAMAFTGPSEAAKH